MDKMIAVGYCDVKLQQQAENIAKKLGATLDNKALPRLEVTNARLELLVKDFLPLFVDFSQSNWQ
jgi:hypothetical protein